jgi:cytochrome c oxidase subunit 2
MISRLIRRSAIALPALLLYGCSGVQSALDPIGPDAARIWQLGALMVAGAGLILLIVCGAVWIAMRGSDAARRRLAANSTIIAGGIAFPVVVLTGLLAYGLWVMRTEIATAATQPQLSVEVTGEMWWWRVSYAGAQDRRVASANEIRIPVGREVAFTLKSADVIHSFWVPNLAGKLDLIPGMQNRLQLVADQPGTYRGQCAEFCGYQHAHMALLVVADTQDDFQRWREAQIQAAQPPADDDSRKGQAVFLSKPCVLCHTVRGTAAGGRIGPDLTHLGSRQYLASGTLPLTRGSLGAWIIDPQTIKPGVHMPMTRLQPEEIDPLLSFLTGLK